MIKGRGGALEIISGGVTGEVLHTSHTSRTRWQWETVFGEPIQGNWFILRAWMRSDACDRVGGMGVG